MKTDFYIVLNIRTAAGFERFGQFELGTDRRVAEALFGALEGREAELARNVKYIAWEIFKWRTLEEGS